MPGEGEAGQIDEGYAVAYTAVERGTPIYSSDGIEVGRVRRVLDNRKEHIFDGLVFESTAGGLRFVDAPEVARTAERAVVLMIDAEQASRLGPPERSRVKPAGPLGRLFGRR